ncbi:Excreted virulence factor EspC, type VII ESX diderm [Mycolicibacterium rutilum]|uniref:Excreted virulence factor EspC, type VII ESX diderm n=1 Tax=Mycolicibacterium rutilum TaxID=370526 RepID=A0A1H6LYW5_MYCRU|nr:type VII secretion target [Mycolicibacterium rutilum]SEH91729.1 Excreted virulence factor EspC, type VII ESX diderm [Mycolicibacterium rutilum]
MHADTDAIRALATANAAHADELAAIASRLSDMPYAAASFGPVGRSFVAALTAALDQEARALAALQARARRTQAAAARTASAYDDADGRAGARVGGL